MPRGARVDAPGCVQHVMLRGIERRVIFLDDHDRRDLFERLSLILPESGTSCFGWAFMPNHVHMVLRTGPVPLARVMARLGTGYAQAFNRRHDRVGHLFQNRYKSILVESEAQLLALVRYVHRNPLRAGLVPSLAALARFPWTGHATLLGHESAPFQDGAAVLAHFGRAASIARQRLLAWMIAEPDPTREIPEDTAESAHASRASTRPARERPTGSLEDLVARVCAARGILEGELRSDSRTSVLADARAEIAWRACVQLRLPGAAVARALGWSQATVSRARARARARLGLDAPIPPGDL